MLTFFKPLYFEPAKHIYRIIFEKEYRKYWLLESKLRGVPRFTECRAKIYDWNVVIPDSASFLSTFEAVFVNKIYAFNFAGGEPKILDLGANIGLSVLFFKKLYPKAQITAFEADPKIFGYLMKNIHGNGYRDVELINKAAWHEDTTLKFSSEGADGGRAAFPGDGNLIDIEAVDMKRFLEGRRFDFLKMDIEGAEEFVLPACGEYLPAFKFVSMEYHSKAGRKQCLDRIIGLLSDAGFRIHIHAGSCSPSPFVELRMNAGYDLMLNIFAWKEQ